MHTHRSGDHVTVQRPRRVPGSGPSRSTPSCCTAREPSVVDTRLGLPDRDFVRDLSSAIDPAEAR
jgi:hypothetical protein